MTIAEKPAEHSNALILEFIIQLLCQEESLEKLQRLKGAYTQQLTKLSNSLITHVQICYDFGYIPNHDMPIYIKLIKDHNIDPQKLETMELDESTLFKNRTSISGQAQIFNTLNMMLGTIEALRAELKEFEEIQTEKVEIKRPSSSLWLIKAYDVCLAMQAELDADTFWHKPFDMIAFSKHVEDYTKKELADFLDEHRVYVVQQILSFIDQFSFSAKLTAWHQAKLKAATTEQVV